MSSPLTLEKLDERSWLVARIGRQGLSLLGEDGGGTHDELAITPHQSPNHRQRSHVYSSQSYTVKILHLWLAPCTAALYSTASSGLMDVFGSLSLKNFCIMDCISVIQSSLPQVPILCTGGEGTSKVLFSMPYLRTLRSLLPFCPAHM